MNSSHLSLVPSQCSLRALDALTFIQVGIEVGIPFLAIYLQSVHWNATRIGTALAAVGSVAIVKLSSFPQIVAVQILLGVVGAIFPPAIAAISLGMVGRDGLDRRIGRNETFNHAGNVV